MVVGVLQVEMHVPRAQSLKDRRAVVKSLRDQMRSRFNIAVAVELIRIEEEYL